jgi:hypothetical protein
MAMMRRAMISIAAVLDFLFGCHHSKLRGVFTIGGRSYPVCRTCGARLHRSTPKIDDKFRQWLQIWLNVTFLLKGAFHAG